MLSLGWVENAENGENVWSGACKRQRKICSSGSREGKAQRVDVEIVIVKGG